MPSSRRRRPPGTVVQFENDAEHYYITTTPGMVIRIHTVRGARLGIIPGYLLNRLEDHEMMFEDDPYWRTVENPCPIPIIRYVPEEYRA